MELNTKADFTALMYQFLDPLKPYYSAGCARMHLGETGAKYKQSTIELEAFSRPLWALVPFWTGGGADPEFESIYRKGLAAGSDPESPEYWGRCKNHDHPFWAAEAAPLPALDALKPMPFANMLVQRRAGRVTAYPAGVNQVPGHGQFPEKYAKFAYDTRFGFCASRSREVIEQAAPDSMLAFVIDRNVFVRRASESWKIEKGAVVTTWSPFPGIEVTTTITPTATGHHRHHEVDSAFDCEAYDTGFAVPNFAPGYDETVENHSAEAHCDTLCCKVSSASDEGEGVLIKCDPNTSLYFANVRLPAVKYTLAKGHTVMDTDITDIAEK